MQRYEHYKDSGIEWIGEIPEHWEVRKLKFLLKPGNEGIKIGPFGSSLKSNSLTKSGFKVYGQENVINNDFERGYRYIDQEKFDELKVYEILPNDLLVTMMGTTGLAKLVPHNIQKGIMDSHLIRIRPKDKEIVPEYLQTLINDSNYIFHQKRMLSKGSIMEGLNSSIIKSFNILLPPPIEQTAIADFLDRKTAEIDSLIEKKTQLICLYEEEKAAIINQAVTRGLDPQASLKPSGVEWLGDIPAHWEVLALKRCVETKITDGPHETPDFVTQGVPFISVDAIQNGKINFESKRGYISKKDDERYALKCKPKRGDIFIVKSGSTTGKIGFVDTDKNFNIWSPLALVRVNSKNNSRYLFQFLQSDFFQIQVKLSWSFGTQPNIGMNVIENLKVIVPPKEEQTAIVTHIDTECARIDAIIAKFRKQIDLFKEYRATLISEAVTGKLDVRQA